MTNSKNVKAHTSFMVPDWESSSGIKDSDSGIKVPPPGPYSMEYINK